MGCERKLCLRPCPSGLVREELGAVAVLQVAPQDAAFDQNGARRQLPFVVDVDGAARPLQRGVIDHGAELARHFFAHSVRVVARLLAVEIRLESVADRLVQEDSTVSRRQHYVHLARGRLARIKHDQSLLHGLLGVPLGRLPFEILEPRPATTTRGSRLTISLILRDHSDTESDQGLTVSCHVPEAVGDQYLSHAFGKRGIDTSHSRIGGARSLIGTLENRLLHFAIDVE